MCSDMYCMCYGRLCEVDTIPSRFGLSTSNAACYLLHLQWLMGTKQQLVVPVYHVMLSAWLNWMVVHFCVVNFVHCLPNVFTMFFAARKHSFHRFRSCEILK